MFSTAYQVLEDQHLFDTAHDLARARTDFYQELRAILRDIDHVEQIAHEQFFIRETGHSTPADTTSTTAQQPPLTDGASHADS
ncbi:hypothetical protein H7J71_27135 [Mycolicibacterium peregrinum]|uniref:hypothetical protein n=1 Tax=Mycolicibacterium peregrinum TaxID=43304 RepID=UPI0006D76C2C|nr:hypothetical protein [Mycolicibacterium peregrinum]MCV7205689.1 hypothetical protein [Mycolicibacterium peregrinum]